MRKLTPTTRRKLKSTAAQIAREPRERQAIALHLAVLHTGAADLDLLLTLAPAEMVMPIYGTMTKLGIWGPYGACTEVGVTEDANAVALCVEALAGLGHITCVSSFRLPEETAAQLPPEFINDLQRQTTPHGEVWPDTMGNHPNARHYWALLIKEGCLLRTANSRPSLKPAQKGRRVYAYIWANRCLNRTYRK